MKGKYISILAVGVMAAGVAWLAIGDANTALGMRIFQIMLFAALIAGIVRYAFTTKEKAITKDTKFSSLEITPEQSNVTFCDVAANVEAKRNLQGLVDYLKNPEKYASYGARIPRGVLLYGPPGTGKTLLAKALAGEAGVPFFALSGSDFVQMYVGVGASRVRDLFKKAKAAGKCVIFIDEIDAMGKKRSDGNSDERDQTLNALLSEMSGFNSSDKIIVLAATNRIETLDSALTRPGRFDKHIEVGLPSLDARCQILKLHSKNKPMDESVDFDRLASDTATFSGAAIETMLNEAAIIAASRNEGGITQGDIDRAFYNTVAGEDKKPTQIKSELMIIALHEAGHAIATKILMPAHRIARVSILPTSGGAAGYSLSIQQDKSILTELELKAQIRVLLAGRAAEEMIAGEDHITSGASNDIERATQLASTMIADLGMMGTGPISLRILQKTFGSNNSAAERCIQIIKDCYDDVTQLLSENAKLLMSVTETLLEKETLSGDELEVLVSEAKEIA